MDKVLAVIIIFIAICVILASIIAMGAVPKIFETNQNQQNQTELIIKQFQRENNTTNKILANQNKTIYNQGVVIGKLNQTIDKLDKSLENQNIMLLQMNETIKHNAQDLALNLNISRQHQQVAWDHDRIMNETKNTTKHIDDSLYQYGENSVTKFNEIRKAQDEILNRLP